MLTRLLCLCLLAVVACTAPDTNPSPPPPSPSDSAAYVGWPPETTDFDIIPNPVSTERVVGPNRFLVNLYNMQNQSLVSADRPVEFNFYDLAIDPANAAFSAEAVYLPILPPDIGLYRATVDFPRAGEWGLEAITYESDGSHLTGRMIFDVAESGTTPVIGAPAPAADTPTATTDGEIRTISTDRMPNPDFYLFSVTQAEAAGEPFLLIFSTPAFCSSRTCGPALDIVKRVAPDYEGRVNFIHVEPYQIEESHGGLQLATDANNYPIPVPAVEAFGLPTEPYIFIIDASGNVAAKFEGVAGEDELRAALDAVSN